MKLSDFNNLIAKRDIQDEDWKTALSQKKPRIKKGEQVKFIKECYNYYGKFLLVEYNGLRYYVKPEDFDGNYLILNCITGLERLIFFRDRFDKEYVLKDGEEKLELLKENNNE